MKERGERRGGIEREQGRKDERKEGGRGELNKDISTIISRFYHSLLSLIGADL